MKRRALALGLAGCVGVSMGWAAGCRTPPPVPAPPSAAGPIVELPADDPAPRRLLDAWTQRAAWRRGLRATAKLSVDRVSADGERAHFNARQAVAIERPGRLRVEVLGFLDQTLAVIATDGARFEIFRAEDGSTETGEVGAALLWREAGIALTPPEAVAVLLGAPLPDPAADPEAGLAPLRATRVGGADGEIGIELADAEGAVRQRLFFDRSGRLGASESVGTGGELLWRVDYGDYRDVAGAAFAHRIDLYVRAGATSARIALRDVELNPALAADIFRLDGGGE